MLDARDTEKKWFDAHVVEIELAVSGSGEQDQVKVHYRGWTTKWDAWFPRNAEEIQPLFSQTENWRDLKIGDSVEVRYDATPEPNKPLWYEGEVMQLDPAKARTPQVVAVAISRRRQSSPSVVAVSRRRRRRGVLSQSQSRALLSRSRRRRPARDDAGWRGTRLHTVTVWARLLAARLAFQS